MRPSGFFYLSHQQYVLYSGLEYVEATNSVQSEVKRQQLNNWRPLGFKNEISLWTVAAVTFSTKFCQNIRNKLTGLVKKLKKKILSRNNANVVGSKNTMKYVQKDNVRWMHPKTLL
jgi:hypothetical protein